MIVKRFAQLVACLLALAGLLAGCRAPHREAAEQNVQLMSKDAQLARLQEQVGKLEDRIAELEAQVKTLQGLGEKRLSVVFHPHRIELGKMTSGFRGSDPSSDAGVRVFVRPVDEQGSTLKAAGDVRVELFDLANPADQQFLGACTYAADQMGKYWMSASFANQYAFECPWPAHPPVHSEVTVRVVFVDYLTGQTLTAQTVVKVKPPAAIGESGPAGSAPAQTHQP
jgi:uncharacterized protein YdcH (DUF465 family)